MVGARHFLAGLAAFTLAGELAAEVVIYPSPGDLSTIAHLKQSGDFTVQVNGRSCFVYESPKYFVHPKGWGNRPQDTVSFTSFAFRDEAVTVTVTSTRPIKTAVLRPKSLGLPYSVSGNTITFALKSPQKISVEVNDQRRPLLIVGEAPDVPDLKATHYFPPGVHKVGTKQPIKAGERVYIAAGAVVEGTLLCLGPNNTFRGRGILTSGYISWAEWMANSALCMFTYESKFTTVAHHDFEGLILLNSPGWYQRGALRDSTVRNVKFIAWNGNTDAFHLAGNALMEDCLMFQNDDCLIGNAGSNNTWRRCVVWKGNYGRAIVSLVSTSCRNFLWEDIDLIGFNGREPAILLREFHNSARATIEGYVIRNIRMESPRPSRLLQIEGENMTVKNVRLEDITTESTWTEEGLINAGGTSTVEGVEFRDVHFAGAPVMNLEAAKLKVSGAVRPVVFSSRAETMGPRVPSAKSGDVR